MASKKKEELLQPEVQTQAQPAAQSTYSAEGLNSRADVEKAMANVSYPLQDCREQHETAAPRAVLLGCLHPA